MHHNSCIFLPENGAFFVNYIVTSAFIGTALELIRFPELFLYAITMIWTRSEAEKITARKVSKMRHALTKSRPSSKTICENTAQFIHYKGKGK